MYANRRSVRRRVMKAAVVVGALVAATLSADVQPAAASELCDTANICGVVHNQSSLPMRVAELDTGSNRCLVKFGLHDAPMWRWCRIINLPAGRSAGQGASGLKDADAATFPTSEWSVMSSGTILPNTYVKIADYEGMSCTDFVRHPWCRITIT
jgi:hypothetical protein